MTDDKHNELLELMSIPEIEEIMMAKLEQVKLIFKDEIRDKFRQKRENIIEFPGGQQKRKPIQRRPLGEDAVLVDTTILSQCSPAEKLEFFNEILADNPKIRDILMEILFVRILPFVDTDVKES